MSDFSSGIMICTAHKELAEQYMETGTYLIKLNDTWLCRLSEDDFCEMSEESYSEAILNMSAYIPLLHVMNAEDYGFEFCILHNKKVGFHFRVDYGVENEFAFSVGQDLYGDKYMGVIHDKDVQDKIQREVRRRYNEVEERIASFFTGISEEEVAQFGLFGFDNETCSKLKNILTVASYSRDEIGYQMIDELFATLMLSEFSFVSHEYVNPDEGIFDIVEICDKEVSV